MCLVEFWGGCPFFKFLQDGHAVNADIYAQQLQQVYDVLKAHYQAFVNWICTLLQHDDVSVDTDQCDQVQNLENLRSWKCYIHISTVQSFHNQNTIFSEPWLISCMNESSTLWMRLKMDAGHFLPVKQSNSISRELSFWHNDDNRQYNIMGYILMNKHFSYVICLNY